jgi:plasmid maintenance system antidote protein VapI
MDMTRKRHPTLTDQIRQAVIDCGESRYSLSRELDIDKGSLSRFVHGQRGLSTANTDLLAEHLGLRIVVERKPKKRKGR